MQTCRKLAQRYQTPRIILKQLEARMVDLHALVTQHLALPTEGYSLKAIAKWLGFRWRNLEASGAQSLVWYAQWQSSRDGLQPAAGDHDCLRTILDYNEDDCLATYRLKAWLAQLHTEELT
ncbi:MAG: TM0106 family RecB-like putative nuclease [Synechococcaceae cyanobacterium SM2_3_60]|nr:TM0106 family RecB-like putative nuclease [Synechococcaceae cyanobacterium SM2_3_60]